MGCSASDAHYEVHLTHCCVNSCKYGDDDCPVATRQVLPRYQCDDCTCIEMNPMALTPAASWWNSLSDGEKVSVYLEHTR